MSDGQERAVQTQDLSMRAQPPRDAASQKTATDAHFDWTFGHVAATLAKHWLLLLLLPLAVGAAAWAASFLLPPVFTARTVLLPPQQQQNSALSALASLSALGALTGNSSGVRSPVDQYVALLQSRAVGERISDAFKLSQIYDEKLKSLTLERLWRNVRVNVGRRDGLIVIEVDDHDPARAAALANRFVDELRRIANDLILTEAQQRRAFFQRQLEQTKDNLSKAQTALDATGFSMAALTSEPRAAADRYARLQAQVTAGEVRLQTLLGSLSEGALEVQQQRAQLSALRGQLARAETPTEKSGKPNYVGAYREFKYQETLFEMFARQFEAARLDESREGALIQVVDVATPPDRNRLPNRAAIAIVTSLVAAALLTTWVLWRASRKPATTPRPLQ
jgi:uncharacterized protein involved in exopolysaccharide biosynthesis